MKKHFIFFLLAVFFLIPDYASAFDFFYPEKIFINGKSYLPTEEVPLQIGENKLVMLFDYNPKKLRPKDVKYRLSIPSKIAQVNGIEQRVSEASNEDDSSQRRIKKKYYCVFTVNARESGTFNLYVTDQQTGGKPEKSNFLRLAAK